MKTILKRIFLTVTVALLLCCSAVPCLATAQSGKITIVLEDNDKNKINGMTVNICQVATLDSVGYYPAHGFENSGISIAGILNNPDSTVAASVVDYIKEKNITATEASSDNGKITFDSLDLGIYVVFPEKNGDYTFNPYIIFLPYESGGRLHYEVNSLPKLEVNTEGKINIYVIKKWDDKNNASKKRPDSVTVELLNGDTVAETATLSEENGWAHTFLSLPSEGNYKIREKAVANYKATYSGDRESGFVITNTFSGEKLPQTGQYWWPVILLATAGVCFVILGVYELRVKKNGKEK